MDGDGRPSFDVDYQSVRTASVAADHPMAISVIRDALGVGPFSLVFLFCSPTADFRSIVALGNVTFPGARVVACTTAGELTEGGYSDDSIVAIGLPASTFAVSPVQVAGLSSLDPESLIGRLILARSALQASHRDFPFEFAHLLVDGLSMKEDQLVSSLSPGLASVPMFGGSSGDGVRFQSAPLALDGQVFNDAAILTFVRSKCPAKVFSFDHFDLRDT